MGMSSPSQRKNQGTRCACRDMSQQHGKYFGSGANFLHSIGETKGLTLGLGWRSMPDAFLINITPRNASWPGVNKLPSLHEITCHGTQGTVKCPRSPLTCLSLSLPSWRRRRQNELQPRLRSTSTTSTGNSTTNRRFLDDDDVDKDGLVRFQTER
jgi:hypothetical protein